MNLLLGASLNLYIEWFIYLFLEMCELGVQKGPCFNISEGNFLAIAEEDVAIALHKLRNTNRFYVNISWIPPPGRLITYM